MTELLSDRRLGGRPGTATRALPRFRERLADLRPGIRATGRHLVSAWPVFVVFLLQRILTLAFTAAVDEGSRCALCAFSLRWDAGWYLRLAQSGYVYPNFKPDGSETASNLAYFPLFPWLVRQLGDDHAFSLPVALVAVSWIGGLLAVWAIFAVGKHLYGRWTGIALAALWGMAPASLALTMGYPEGMFTAAAAATLLCLMRRRPVWAGACALVAGLLRPSAVAVIAAVTAYALVELIGWLVRRRRGARAASAGASGPDAEPTAADEPGASGPDADPDPDSGTERHRFPAAALIGAVLACAGLGSFMIYVWTRTGDPLGYFAVQAQWGQQTAPAGEYWSSIATSLLGPDATPMSVLNIVAGLGYVLLFCLIVFDRRLVWGSVFAAGILLISLTHITFQHVYARQLLPAFVVLIPLVRMRVPRIAAIAAITVGSVIMAWAGAQMIMSTNAAL